ncbi:MAG: hypothetical protein ACOCXM_08005 [Myxococcota bacterium]
MAVVRRALAWAVVVAMLTPALAQARRDQELRYRFNQVWGTTVRLVRVDYGFPIRDRDEEVGYLLFEYQDGDRRHPGSFEIVQVKVDGERRVKVACSIPAMPSYIEQMLIDKLEKKLEADYGEPPPPPRERPERDLREKKKDDEKKQKDDAGEQDDSASAGEG